MIYLSLNENQEYYDIDTELYPVDCRYRFNDSDWEEDFVRFHGKSKVDAFDFDAHVSKVLAIHEIVKPVEGVGVHAFERNAHVSLTATTSVDRHYSTSDWKVIKERYTDYLMSHPQREYRYLGGGVFNSNIYRFYPEILDHVEDILKYERILSD